MALGALALPAAAQTRITSPDAQALDWFGYDVASEGELTIVGSWRDDDAGPNTGSAHLILTRSEKRVAYLQKLVLNGAAAGDQAGLNVAIGDGLIAVSAPGRAMPRAGGSVVHGTVAIFREVNGSWTEITQLDDPSRTDGDLFGNSVAIDSGAILVGAPRADVSAADGGAVYVFSEVGGAFVRTQRIVPADNGQHDYFGHDLAAHSGRAIATAYNDDDRGVNAGAAYALSLGALGWQIDQKLVASEGGHFDLFGTCVDMTADTVVIGAPQNEDTDAGAKINEGAVFICEWSTQANHWTECMILRPGDPSDEHRFGIDVAIDRDVIVVGASHSDSGVLNSGSAHLFRQRQRDWYEVARHDAANPAPYDYLGLSVAVGDMIVVGVPGANDAVQGGGAIDVLSQSEESAPWGQTYCHGGDKVDGFKNVGGPMNRAAKLGRLTPAGSQDIARDDLVLRATGLPEGSFGVLLIGPDAANRRLDDGQLCLKLDSRTYRFAAQPIGADGRLITRHPIGQIEMYFPGAAATMIGSRMYAQVVYYDPQLGRWNSTNAIRIDFE